MIFTWGSCMNMNKTMVGGFSMLREKPDRIALIGDCPYTDNGVNSFGVTVTNSGSDQTVANLTAHHQKARANPGFAEILRSSQSIFRWMWDDHELPGDNYDSSTTNMQAGVGGVTPITDADTQAEVDAIFQNSRDAAGPYFALNPVNLDADATAQKSPNSTLTDADYPVRYFRETVGDTEFFYLDCMSHRSPVRDADNASKTMLGTTQTAWLKAHLLSSTSMYKIIVSPKKTYAYAASENTDIWAANGANTGYTTERNSILQFIEDNSITTVVWLAGDRHTPGVEAMSLADTEPYDHVCVTACPIGVGINAGVSAAGTYTKFIDRTGQVFGRLETFSDHLKVQLKNLHNNPIWTGYIAYGSNALVADYNGKVAI